jgi:hypothetical protein
MKWYCNFKTAVRQLAGFGPTDRALVLTGAKASTVGTGTEVKIGPDNDVLNKNLNAMTKTKCVGCRKL